jgi:hypothetical protein
MMVIVGASSGDEDDLPRDVAGLELGERRSNVVERVRALDRHNEVPRGNRLGELGQGRRAGCGRAAITLDAVLLDRGEVDDRVDPACVYAQPELRCQRRLRRSPTVRDGRAVRGVGLVAVADRVSGQGRQRRRRAGLAS